MNHGMDPDWCAFLCAETESCTIVSESGTILNARGIVERREYGDRRSKCLFRQPECVCWSG